MRTRKTILWRMALHLWQSRAEACSFSSLLSSQNTVAVGKKKKKKKYLFWNFSDIATVCMPSTGFLVLCSKKCGVCLYFQSPSPSSCLKLKKEFPVTICRAALIISFKSHLWYTQLIAGLLLSFEHFLADQYCHIASLCSPVCLAPSVVSCFILKL